MTEEEIVDAAVKVSKDKSLTLDRLYTYGEGDHTAEAGHTLVQYSPGKYAEFRSAQEAEAYGKAKAKAEREAEAAIAKEAAKPPQKLSPSDNPGIA